ncbi:MAG: sulfite exporter TauE/SafE family protein, partial [Pseudomonadota bacterium]
AVAVFVFPNVVSNAWQVWHYRHHRPERGFLKRYALAGVVGAGIGTAALAGMSASVLTTAVAGVVLVYVGFRLRNPGWTLPAPLVDGLAVPVGTAGGVLQGAVGISAPVSVTFLNAAGLARNTFVFTLSTFFLAMAAIQLPMQIALGIMTWERAGYSALGVLPLLLGMPLGDRLGRRIPKATFDRIILAVLTLLAVRLLWQNAV